MFGIITDLEWLYSDIICYFSFHSKLKFIYIEPSSQEKAFVTNSNTITFMVVACLAKDYPITLFKTKFPKYPTSNKK